MSQFWGAQAPGFLSLSAPLRLCARSLPLGYGSAGPFAGPLLPSDFVRLFPIAVPRVTVTTFVRHFSQGIPDDPAEIRGEFKPIATNVAGIQIC